MAEKIYFDSSDSKLNSAIETDTTIATPSNVKKDYLFKDAATRDTMIGTMPIIPSSSIKIDPKCVRYPDSYIYTIPKGYHDGTGKVYVGELKEYTPGTAAPGGVEYGKVFWSNGERLVGTLDITAIKQPGTATANDIVKDKTAWVNGVKLTGTIPNIARKDKTLLAGESYTFPYGLSAGTTIISAASLSSQTQGTAAKADIIKDKVAWVNGERISGTLDIYERIKQELSETDVLQNQVLEGKKFYSVKYDGVKAGTMPDHTGEGTRTIDIGSKFFIPEGYYNGQSSVQTKSLAESTIGTAKAADIINTKIAWVNGLKVTGTMVSNAPSTIEIDAGTAYTIPNGYHTGTGKVKAKTIEKQTEGTATAADITSTKTAWVNGVKVTGTMPDNASSSKEILPGQIYYIPEGYHHGTGTVWTKSLEEATAGTAIAENILISKTAWVNGVKLTGTMPNNESLVVTLQAGEKCDINKGYHDGNGQVKAASLSSQTQGTAVANDIVNSKTAWVNGNKITGTLTLSGTAAKNNVMKGYTFYNTDTQEKLTGTLELFGTVKEEDVIYGKSFYSTDPYRMQTGTLMLSGNADNKKVLAGYTFYNTNPKYMETGTMVNNGQVSKEISAGTSYTIPEGYHNGLGIVRATGLSPQTEGTAEASDIIKDKTAWVNGVKLTGTLNLDGDVTPELVLHGKTYYSNNPKLKLTGTMPTNEPKSISLLAGEEFAISKGYHTGTGIIKAKDLGGQTEGTAIASDILLSKTAWVNGSKLTGTMPNNTATTITLAADESYTIPTGYHSGSGTVKAQDLASQTPGTATENDLIENTIAWVNGERLEGTIAKQTIKVIRIAVGHSVTLSPGVYPEGITIYSIYTDRLDLTGTDAYILNNILYPNTAGYISGDTLIITAELKT